MTWRRNRWLILAALLLAAATPGRAQQLLGQTEAMRDSKSAGCTASGCHVGIEPMHASAAVRLGCTDCHGGDASATSKAAAHVFPKYPKRWSSSANPERTYTLLNDERPEFVRFINPGDLRAAPKTCGSSGCHADVVYKVERSLMTHGAFLWGAALYNNGAYPLNQDFHFGPGTATVYTRVAPNTTSFRAEPCTSPPPIGARARPSAHRRWLSGLNGAPADTAPAKPFWSQKLLILARATLPTGHRQRPDPPQHVAKQPPVQMSLRQ